MIKIEVTRRKLLLWVGGAVGLVALLFAVYTFVALTWTYSRGERAGYVQKFSQRGWLCKTWEGELAMVNVPGPSRSASSSRSATISSPSTCSARWASA
jgi:hypothetical protein